jgi:hypothetical protein
MDNEAIQKVRLSLIFCGINSNVKAEGWDG